MCNVLAAYNGITICDSSKKYITIPKKLVELSNTNEYMKHV